MHRCAVGIFSALTSFSAAASSVDEWRFGVTLDGKSIGYHHFQISERNSHRELVSEARFNVKLLFINAYRYAHDSREQWREGCLHRIAARTDDNGKRNAVNGDLGESGFRIATNGQSAELGPCVMTFAYWDPRMLDATRLLNPQTGEYVPVRIARVGSETLSVRGTNVPANRFRLLGDAKIGGKLVIDLWYSERQEWLALESTTEDGRRLRYELL
jgi:hypothetical protein